MKRLCIVYLLLIIPAAVLPQYITTDTIYVDFTPDTIIPVNYMVSSVIDKRAVHPNLISYAQKRKYLLVPVDQELLTRKSLAENFMMGLQNPFAPVDTLILNINYFIIDRYKGHLGNPYLLKADIPVYKLAENDTLPVGTLVYNYKYQPPRKKLTNPQVYEALLNKWYVAFKMDLMITADYLQADNPAPENLIQKPLKKALFLHAMVGGIVGLNFWQLEGELYFTRPETENRQWFLGNIVRYQHTPEFEMIGFGKKSEHFTSRIDDSWAFEVTSNVLAGFLKWKETGDIKLYQLFQLSLSSIQSISLNKKNVKGLQLKGGIFENFYYVIDMKPKLQAGIYVSAGYKL